MRKRIQELTKEHNIRGRVVEWENEGDGSRREEKSYSACQYWVKNKG